MSRLAKLVSGNKFQIAHLYHYLDNTLKCVFREFCPDAKTSFFVICIIRSAIFKLLLQYFVEATEEFSEPAVVSLCQSSTIRPWPFCNITTAH